MTTGDTSRRRENPFTLVKRLVSGGVALAKLEVQRGRQEMAQNLAHLRGGVVLLAIAAALGLTFLIALVGFVMALPLYLLFEISVLLGTAIEKRRERGAERVTEALGGGADA